MLTLLAGTILGLGLRQRIPLYLLPVIFLGVVPLVLVIATSYYAVAGRHRLRAAVLLVATLISYGPLQFGWNIPFLPLALRWPTSNRSQDMTLVGPIIFLAWLVTYLGPRVWASRHHLSPTWRRPLAIAGLGVSIAALGLTLWYFHGTVSWNVRGGLLATAADALSRLAVGVLGKCDRRRDGIGLRLATHAKPDGSPSLSRYSKLLRGDHRDAAGMDLLANAGNATVSALRLRHAHKLRPTGGNRQAAAWRRPAALSPHIACGRIAAG